jgi:hypothetical protein
MYNQISNKRIRQWCGVLYDPGKLQRVGPSKHECFTSICQNTVHQIFIYCNIFIIIFNIYPKTLRTSVQNKIRKYSYNINLTTMHIRYHCVPIFQSHYTSYQVTRNTYIDNTDNM